MAYNDYVTNIQNAETDAIDLGRVVNGEPNTQVNTRLGQRVWTLATLNNSLDNFVTASNQQLVNNQAAHDVQMSDFNQAINAAAAAAAGANGWTDLLIRTAMGRTQRDKNSDFIDLRDYVNFADTDHTAALQQASADAKAKNKKLVGSGKYYIKSGDVNLRSISCDLSACEFIVTEPYKIIMGGISSTALNPTQSIGVVRNPTFNYTPDTVTNPTIRVIGAKNQTINIRFVQYLQFWQSTTADVFSTDSSQAYSTFNISYAIKLSVDTDPANANGSDSDGVGSRNQWFNENTINLNRCVGFYMRGSYAHNHNVIRGGSFENDALIRIERGNKNYFYNIRFESNTGGVYFGESTQGNVIEKTWFGSAANWMLPPTVTDLGQLNSVRTYQDIHAIKRNVLAISSSTTTYNNRIGQARVGGSHLAIKTPTGEAGLVGKSKLFRIHAKDYLIAQIDGVADSYYNVKVFLYDANKKLLNLSNTSIAFEGMATVNTTLNSLDIGVSSLSRLALLDSTAVYARVEVWAVAGFNRQVARNINVYINSLRPMENQVFGDVQADQEFYIVSAKPTQFVGKLGDVVRQLDGTTYRCSHMIYTDIASVTDSTHIAVTNQYSSLTGSSIVNDLIGIELSDNSIFWTTISAISGTNITLATAIPDVAKVPVGSVVYISRLS